MILRAFYSSPISQFLYSAPSSIMGTISHQGGGDSQEQFRSWAAEIDLLQDVLMPYGGRGEIHLEFRIPRLGKRVDALLLIDGVIFILEFKVGRTAGLAARDQAMDYALDLKHFHSTSAPATIFPIVVAEKTTQRPFELPTASADGVYSVVETDQEQLSTTLAALLGLQSPCINRPETWKEGIYSPTPTIIEAAQALYANHSIADLSRNDAGAKNLATTTDTVSDVIKASKKHRQKAICFVTGVPGAGKTLVGLNLATSFSHQDEPHHSVYLSGNGPLVSVLREALARDSVSRAKRAGQKRTKSEANHEVQAFVQNVHHFRDEGIVTETPPIEHVAIFDEAQRAWGVKHTASFMKRRKGVKDFNQSEPAFLISCMDRHPDWAVVVCLVGGGQEINRGEAGIKGWLTALAEEFPHWQVYMSPHLRDAEYDVDDALAAMRSREVHIDTKPELHLSVSMRSYRAEHVSQLVKEILDVSPDEARMTLEKIGGEYPIFLTRSLDLGKRWIRDQARGSQRYGLVVSSYAERLKPYAIDVKSPMNPLNWFLNDKRDVRSSFYLESVATEFHVQGLELDWACVAWDADFRFEKGQWNHRSFRGNRWTNVNKEENQVYQKNAYRVLLTRARLGMVIVVPEGDPEDPTRQPDYYNSTFNYLKSTGIPILG